MNFSPLKRLLLYTVLVGFLASGALAAVFYVKLSRQLPSIEVLKDVQLQVPLRVFSRDMRLLAEFGEKRRTPVKIEDVPQALIQAFLAAEDNRFFDHPGVDLLGLLRAAYELVRTGEKRQGGSTITMQVARNFFLSQEKTYLRKITEILLSFKIEQSLSKEEILELYLNKIYLGQRAYGVQAASEVYYGTGINELSIAQMAMIAALPKAPSRVNPVNNPAAALARRDYVLGRMHSLGYLDEHVYQEALAEPDKAELHAARAEAGAPYVAEMVRRELFERYGSDAYISGLQVVTTIESNRQAAANRALQQGLLEYGRRHGYHGPEARVDLNDINPDTWPELVAEYSATGGLEAGLVTMVNEQSVQVFIRREGLVTIEWEGLSWARPYKSTNSRGTEPKQAGDLLAVGDIIRVIPLEDGKWGLSQIPDVEGALVSLRPDDGAVMALVGGFDFNRSKFNRAIQAQRQPGSSFKPMIYSAALEKGFTPASVINDAPVVFDDPALEATWRPENYSGRFYGPTRLREALYRSRNLVSIRLLRSITSQYAADYAQRFGFSSSQLPRDLTLALGSGSVTPMQMAIAFAVLANGGYRVEPYFIHRIHNANGEVIYQADPVIVCPHCPDSMESIVGDGPGWLKLAEQVITPQNAWLMNSMLLDVIQRGTGKAARVLGRSDLAGKTGTTNDQIDAWFCGYNPSLVAVTWMGFDKLEPLGSGETGGRAALPIWIDYMREALKGTPPQSQQQPDGLVTVRIDPATGLLAASGQSDAIFETFRADEVPKQSGTAREATTGSGYVGGSAEPLF